MDDAEHCECCDRRMREGDERYVCQCGNEPVCKACWCGEVCIQCEDDIEDAADEEEW